MKKITDYTIILDEGQENAITARELQEVLGFADIRSLRADISKARCQGQLVLSTPKGEGGYYLPKSREEVEEFVYTYSRQAISLLRALRSARQYLNRDEQQLSFKDIVDEWDSEEGASYD